MNAMMIRVVVTVTAPFMVLVVTLGAVHVIPIVSISLVTVPTLTILIAHPVVLLIVPAF